MQAAAPSRPPLEPLAPALVAVGLAHLLLAALVWIFLPMLARQSQERTAKVAALDWRSPADFVGSVSDVLPVTQPTPTDTPPPTPQAPVSKPNSLTVTLPSGEKTNQAPPAVAQVSQQTLSTISSTITSMVAGKNSPSPTQGLTINPLEQAPVKPAALPLPTTVATPQMPAAPEATPPPAKIASVLTGERREANKYITLSAIVPEAERPAAKIAPMKPVLNLLDIAVLNESKRAVESAAGGADMSQVEQSLQQALLREWIAPDIRAVNVSQRRAALEITVRRDGSVTDKILSKPSGSPLLDDSIREAAERVTKIPQTLPSSFPKERYNLRVNFLIE